MGVTFRVSAHVGQNHDLCLSTHGTLWYNIIAIVHLFLYDIIFWPVCPTLD